MLLSSMSKSLKKRRTSLREMAQPSLARRTMWPLWRLAPALASSLGAAPPSCSLRSCCFRCSRSCIRCWSSKPSCRQATHARILGSEC